MHLVRMRISEVEKRIDHAGQGTEMKLFGALCLCQLCPGVWSAQTISNNSVHPGVLILKYSRSLISKDLRQGGRAAQLEGEKRSAGLGATW